MKDKKEGAYPQYGRSDNTPIRPVMTARFPEGAARSPEVAAQSPKETKHVRRKKHGGLIVAFGFWSSEFCRRDTCCSGISTG